VGISPKIIGEGETPQRDFRHNRNSFGEFHQMADKKNSPCGFFFED